jgi:HSP20 family protein
MISEKVGSASDFDDVVLKVNKFMDQFMQKSFFRFRPCERWQPSINVYESKDHFRVCLELAGIDPKQVQLHVEDNVLYVMGHRQTPSPAGHETLPRIHVMEIDHGAFSRAIKLPGNIDQARIEAKYSHGLLWIDVPKTSNE